MTETSMQGGCNCGAIRYTLKGPPLGVAACHCTSCRRQSGVAYSVNLIVRADAMGMEGEPARWTDHDTQSGQPLSREFCGTCGSPIRSVPSSSPKVLAVKAGTLDRPESAVPAMHIWTRSKLPWVTVPEGIPQFETSPQL